MFVLCDLHETEINYYGFNTFCFLASGLIRRFILLCRAAFEIAEFEDQNKLINGGTISSSIQAKAARDVAKRQYAKIVRIPIHGKEIQNIMDNIGYLFASYHRDWLISYPEQNQFTIIDQYISESHKKILDSAESWSVIQRRPRRQSSSPGKRRTVIYVLNKIYAPYFKYSVRTRGGINIELDAEDISNMIQDYDYHKKIYAEHNPEEDKQMELL